jgi:hypothetical protein
MQTGSSEKILSKRNSHLLIDKTKKLLSLLGNRLQGKKQIEQVQLSANASFLEMQDKNANNKKSRIIQKQMQAQPMLD